MCPMEVRMASGAAPSWGYAVQPWNVWRFPYGVTGQPSSATRPLAKSLLLSVAAGMNATLRLSEPVEWQG
jgi:hypothetical protein